MDVMMILHFRCPVVQWQSMELRSKRWNLAMKGPHLVLDSGEPSAPRSDDDLGRSTCSGNPCRFTDRRAWVFMTHPTENKRKFLCLSVYPSNLIFSDLIWYKGRFIWCVYLVYSICRSLNILDLWALEVISCQWSPLPMQWSVRCLTSGARTGDFSAMVIFTGENELLNRVFFFWIAQFSEEHRTWEGEDSNLSFFFTPLYGSLFGHVL